MSNKLIIKLMLIIFILLMQVTAILSTDENTILEIRDIYPEQLVMKGFSLDRDMKLEIQATVGIARDEDYLLSACWILNVENREMIWQCSLDNSEKERHGRELKCKQQLNLTKGSYEVYYALNPSPYFKIKGVGDFIDQIFKGFKTKKHSPQWGIKIKSQELKYIHEYLPPKDEQAIIQITKLRDSQFTKKGFSISKPLKVRIYAIGEGSKNRREISDYGWIVDANSRERIWEMTYRNTEHAGGALKNIKFDDIISLPAGDYLVYFVTDDSHSSKKWNQLPPYDPTHWGITIWGAETGWDQAIVKQYTHYEPEPIIELTHIRNHQFEMGGFTLTKNADLHIYALGEYSRSRSKFVDYSWIVDAFTREIFWQMDYDNTDHAGGGKKNRVFDDIISVPAGSYLVYYLTDDSHAYRQWNVQRPFQPEAWGITIYPTEDGFSSNDLKEYSEDNDRNILAQIIQVRNKENLNANFSLDQPTKIRIYAIGEGGRSEMYDYGWIEDDRGHAVWKMKYCDTERAGGAKKNRLFNNVISLEPGHYLVRYKSDGSHCYRKWNASPPVDRFHWGITVIKQSSAKQQ